MIPVQRFAYQDEVGLTCIEFCETPSIDPSQEIGVVHGVPTYMAQNINSDAASDNKKNLNN